jgi:hypothetical protein
MRLSVLAAMWAGTVLVVVPGAALGDSPQQADAFEQKLGLVIERGHVPPSGHRTEFVDTEVNAYLQLRLIREFPAGVTEPSVTLVGQGRVHGRAVVDLDGIRRNSSGGWFDPAAYLSGRLPVTATGTLKTSNGRGQFLLEGAEVSGVPVPKSLLQELVSYYTRSAALPNGVDLDEPFDLPVRIQRIDVDPGRAVVVQ